MEAFKRMNDVEPVHADGHLGYRLLNESNGCCSGSSTGVSVYFCEEYPQAASHDDQEGFYVFAGKGWAKIGDVEFRLEPGMSFVAPKGVAHCMKKDKDCDELKIFWFHCRA
jgi:mannose-6-phosphate isomerase-like protein (cupin superfamily)